MHACMCGNQHIGNTHSCLSKQRNLSARGTHHARNLQLVIPTPAWIILSLQLAPGMPESAPEGVVVTCMLRSQLIACAALHLRGLHHGILTQRSLDNWTSGRALPDNNRKFCMALGFLMMITYPYGYAHFYPAEPEHSSAPRSGQAPGRTLGQRARAWLPSIQRRQQHATTEAACEVEEARQHHLGMQQQHRMRQQPEMRPQPLLPVPSAQLPSLTQQHPAAGSCMVPAGSGRDRRRLNAAGAAALYGLPSPLQATGTADLRHMHPQQRQHTPLCCTARPHVPHPIAPLTVRLHIPHRPVATPAALYPAAAIHAQCSPARRRPYPAAVRDARGSRAEGVQIAPLADDSAYKQQLFDLHMLSQVQKLLMSSCARRSWCRFKTTEPSPHSNCSSSLPSSTSTALPVFPSPSVAMVGSTRTARPARLVHHYCRPSVPPAPPVPLARPFHRLHVAWWCRPQ